jgi:hypothetical protein
MRKRKAIKAPAFGVQAAQTPTQSTAVPLQRTKQALPVHFYCAFKAHFYYFQNQTSVNRLLKLLEASRFEAMDPKPRTASFCRRLWGLGS